MIEVSEPEEEELPAKKVGRTKKLVCGHFLVDLLLLISPFRRPQVPKADEFRILYVALITLYRILIQSFPSLEKKVVGRITTFSSPGQNPPHQPDHRP